MSIEVTIKTKGDKSYAIAQEDSKRAGVMTFRMPQDDLIIIDHTEVNEDFQGRKVGDIMLDAVVDKARNENRKIIPLCPFANARFKRRDDIKDVLKEQTES